MIKKIYIKSFGCQMNVRDSEAIAGILKKSGYQITNDQDKADIVILNTCSVRQHAEDRVWSAVGMFKDKDGSHREKISNQKRTVPIVGLVGCMAQNYKEAIFERAPQVDFVVGPSDIAKIPQIIKKVSGCRSPAASRGLFENKIWETEGEGRPEEIYHTGFYEDKGHAFVVISEGCSNYCSYCVVPFVRGDLRHRSHKGVLKEIEEAAEKGITKITLLGQNVNAYQSPVSGLQSPVNFIELLKLVNKIKGIKEFSFFTSHPKDTYSELFKVMAGLEKLKKHLHLPVQSGSDKMLKLMNRGYTRKFYLDLAHNYRRIVKNGSLTTDIIVGFPTETEEDFRDTFELVKEAAFNAAYIFKYSTRPRTEAARLIDDVARKEKEKRHALILKLQRAISKKVKVKE